MSRRKTGDTTSRGVIIGLLAVMAIVLGLAAAWHWSPLHELADASAVAHKLKSVARTPWMPLVAAFVYVAASLVMFPNTVLCFAIIMALGPIWGAAYAFGGSLAAALAGYAIGRRGGKHVDKLHLGPFSRASAELRKGGFMRVLALRMLPVVPFSATNILSGAARVNVLHFAIATVIGISPYIVAFAAFGRQVRRMLAHPTVGDAAIMLAIAAAASVTLWQARSWAEARAK